MSNKRDSAKQRRARQNRARREALEARTKSAGEPSRPSRKAPAASSRTRDAKGGGSIGDGDEGKPRKAGFFSGGGQPRRPRPGDVPVDIETLEGNWFTKRNQVPGGRQVMTAGLLTAVVSVMMAVWWKVPPDSDPDGKATETLFDVFGPAALLIIGVPLAAMVLAAQFTLSEHRRRIWIGSALVMAVVLPFGGFNYLFPAGFLMYAIWRAGKIEGPPPNSRAARAAARRADTEELDDDLGAGDGDT